MNKLTRDKLDTIFKDGNNLTGKPIYIDFYADWWGPCRMFSSVLDNVTPSYHGNVDMYKVDIESEPDIAIKFGARSLPYMVFISKDGKISPETGAMTADQLKYYLDGLISK